MNCRDIKRKLALLVGGDLPADEVTVVERHLAQCPACHTERQSLSDSQTILRAVCETPTQPLERPLWPRVRPHLPQSHAYAGRPAYLGWLPTASLAAACLALLLFAGSTPLLTAPQQPVSFIDPSFQPAQNQYPNFPQPSLDLRPVTHREWSSNSALMPNSYAWPVQNSSPMTAVSYDRGDF